MEQTPVEVKLIVPCGETRHAVTLALIGWGEWEVTENPCRASGEDLSEIAPCEWWLYRFAKNFQDGEFEHHRLQLVKQVARAGLLAVPILTQALRDRSGPVHTASAETLVQIGQPAVPALIEALMDDEWYVRKASAEALGKLRATQAVSALIEALKDSYWYVRQASAEALVRIGQPAVPALIEALKASDSGVRRASAEALGRIGDPQAIPPLQQALQEEQDSWTRTAIQEALKQLQSSNR